MLTHCETESHPQALVQAVNAVLLPSPDSLLQALQQLRLSIQDITRALGQMHGKGLLKAEGSLAGEKGPGGWQRP